MFWQCSASIELQGRHEFPTGSPVDVSDFGGRELAEVEGVIC